jgi:hypothetical protein
VIFEEPEFRTLPPPFTPPQILTHCCPTATGLGRLINSTIHFSNPEQPSDLYYLSIFPSVPRAPAPAVSLPPSSILTAAQRTAHSRPTTPRESSPSPVPHPPSRSIRLRLPPSLQSRKRLVPQGIRTPSHYPHLASVGRRKETACPHSTFCLHH